MKAHYTCDLAFKAHALCWHPSNRWKLPSMPGLQRTSGRSDLTLSKVQLTIRPFPSTHLLGGHFPGSAQAGVVAPHDNVPRGQEAADKEQYRTANNIVKIKGDIW
jgi:hypothetical protein